LLLIKQYGGEHDDHYRLIRFALFIKLNPRGSTLYINGQETIKFLPMTFITRQLGFTIFPSPGEMRIGCAL